MERSTALRAIDFLHEQSDGKCVVTFFGGEPLLELDLIKDVVSYSRGQYGTQIAFRMSTNGTLLSEEILAFLSDNEIYFVLSIDGCEQQHNMMRHYVDGKGSYHVIEKNLAEVLRINPYTLAVSVVTPETAGYLSAGVQDLFRKGFRYVVQTLDYSAPWQEHDLWELKHQYRLLAAYYGEQIMSGEKIYYSPFDERIKTWAQKPYSNGDPCDLANTQIAIAPSGRIYPCVQFIGDDSAEFQENVIGEVFSGFDDERRCWFIEQNYHEKETCKGCALRGRCATFCGCVNWRATGKLDQIPPIICAHERMLLPIVDKMASRLWSRNSELFKRKFYEKTYPISSYIDDCQFSVRRVNAQDKAG
jgi:uncharacterized protein